MENDIRVLKLSSGEELVAHVILETERTYELDFPMKVLTKYIAESEDLEDGVEMDTINMLVPWINSSIDTMVELNRSAIMAESVASEFCQNEWAYQVSQFLDEPKTELAARTEQEPKPVQASSNILSFPNRKDSE